jgi:hypothetical protein
MGGPIRNMIADGLTDREKDFDTILELNSTLQN